jgi:hypothetical protein
MSAYSIAGGVLPAESLATALRVLWVALNFRLGLALGLVFVMTAKPGFGIACTGIAVGGVVGLTASLMSGRGISPPLIAVRAGGRATLPTKEAVDQRVAQADRRVSTIALDRLAPAA